MCLWYEFMFRLWYYSNIFCYVASHAVIWIYFNCLKLLYATLVKMRILSIRNQILYTQEHCVVSSPVTINILKFRLKNVDIFAIMLQEQKDFLPGTWSVVYLAVMSYFLVLSIIYKEKLCLISAGFRIMTSCVILVWYWRCLVSVKM
jgi:hypothetical protein